MLWFGCFGFPLVTVLGPLTASGDFVPVAVLCLWVRSSVRCVYVERMWTCIGGGVLCGAYSVADPHMLWTIMLGLISPNVRKRAS